MIQILTGICLAFVYIPSANEAYTSLEYLNFHQALGWYLRAVHYWGSNFMVSIMMLHMAQVFLFGAFKYPRELTWITGCVLLLCTLGMAFTGQIMRFDQDAYWGLGIGAAIIGRVPLIGSNLVHLLLGRTHYCRRNPFSFFYSTCFRYPRFDHCVDCVTSSTCIDGRN